MRAPYGGGRRGFDEVAQGGAGDTAGRRRVQLDECELLCPVDGGVRGIADLRRPRVSAVCADRTRAPNRRLDRRVVFKQHYRAWGPRAGVSVKDTEVQPQTH